MANLFDLVAKLTLDSSEYASGLDAALGKAKKIGGTIAKVGTAAVGAAAAGIVAFGKSAVDAGMTFDSSMSQVAATMGTTVDEISELRDFAQEMGSTTAFSATQAADALNYMALAGYDAETSMQMLPNVLNLAAAGGIELASASDMVTDAQSALGLSLEETSELVDKMAKASSKSNTSVAQLGDAILTVGGTAKNLAGGTTELSTALGILADNGIKGAEGGTALRNIILSLSAPTDTAAKKMAELGLSAYDAEGNLRPMQDIFSDLNSTLSTMTQGEQTEVLNTLFNKVDLKSANALLATSADRWDELSGAIDDASGAAQQMADTQLDNLAGDITLFKSALEGAQIVLSDQLSPTLREFVQLGTSGIQQITDGFKEGGLEGAFGALGDWLGEAINKVVQRLPTLIDSALSLLENVASALMDNSDQIIGTVFDVIKRLGKAAIDNAPVVIEAVFEILDNVVETLADPEFLGGLVDGAISIIEAIANGLIENLPVLIPAVIDIILTLAEKLVDPNNITVLMGAATDIMLALIDGIMASLPDLISRAPELIMDFAMAIINMKVQLFLAGVQILGELILGIASVFENLTQNGREIVQKVWDGVKQRIEEAKTWGKDLIQNFISGITAKWQALKEKVSGIASGIKSLIGFSEPEEGPLSDFHTYAPDMMELFAKGVTDNAGMLHNKIAKAFDFSDAATMPEMTYSVTGTDSRTAQNNDSAILNAILARLNSIEAYLPKLGTIELDGEVVANSVDQRLGRIAAQKARV